VNYLFAFSKSVLQAIFVLELETLEGKLIK